MTPTRKKRTAHNDADVDARHSAVIAPTPSKMPRNDHTFETPRRPATPSNNAVAVIPESSVADSNNNEEKNGDFLTSQAAQLPSRPRTLNNPHARRAILLDAIPAASVPPPVTPAHASTKTATTVTPSTDIATKKPAAKRRLIFGKMVEEIAIKSTTKRVYNLVKKLTGSLGGNGSCGPIYGELTIGSMQKMVNLMQQYTFLDHTSRFIDVGSGIGKPSLHVTQDPGVALSCGIEMELDRWRLSLKSLQRVLQEANKDAIDTSILTDDKIRHQCMFLHGNIMEAKTFDPFTHVYMFSIGFPPMLWVYLSEAWNRSQSPYMICFHGPKTIINDYEFEVELLAQTPTSMHASGEGHTGYIYQRKGLTEDAVRSYVQNAPCDKVFELAKAQIESGLWPLREFVDQAVADNWVARRSMTRSEAKIHGIVLSKTS